MTKKNGKAAPVCVWCEEPITDPQRVCPMDGHFYCMTEEQREAAVEEVSNLWKDSNFEQGRKRVRGRAQKSLELIQAMYDFAEESQPITGRGIGYKLFTTGLIPSMARNEMAKVYRLLKDAREEGTIP